MAGACSRVAKTRPGGPATRSHDTARKGHDTVSQRAGVCNSARARGLDDRGVVIQKLYRGWGATVVSQYGAAGLRYNAVTRQQRAATPPAILSNVRATKLAMCGMD